MTSYPMYFQGHRTVELSNHLSFQIPSEWESDLSRICYVRDRSDHDYPSISILTEEAYNRKLHVIESGGEIWDGYQAYSREWLAAFSRVLEISSSREITLPPDLCASADLKPGSIVIGGFGSHFDCIDPAHFHARYLAEQLSMQDEARRVF